MPKQAQKSQLEAPEWADRNPTTNKGNGMKLNKQCSVWCLTQC